MSETPVADFFIPQPPRVGGFAGRQRRRQERYLRPALEQVPRPLPRSQRLRVSYRFVFRDPDVYLEGGRGIYRTDIDNMLKFLNDLLTGVVWEDDSQIFELHAVKKVGEEEGIGVTVWRLG